MLPLWWHLQMVWLLSLLGWGWQTTGPFLQLFIINSAGRQSTHTLNEKSRRRSSRCGGLSHLMIKCSEICMHVCMFRTINRNLFVLRVTDWKYREWLDRFEKSKILFQFSQNLRLPDCKNQTNSYFRGKGREFDFGHIIMVDMFMFMFIYSSNP